VYRHVEKTQAYSNSPHDLWEHAPRYAEYLADVKIPEPETLMDHGAGRSAALDRSLQNIAGEKLANASAGP
jgi:hypothetical protein